MFGDDEEYLEYIKKICERFKKAHDSVCKTKDYLFFEKVIQENLSPITDCDLKRNLNKSSCN